jgi:hypothetical protein
MDVRTLQGFPAAFFHFIGTSDFEGTKNKRTFVEHTLDDRIMNIINRP